MKIKYIALVLAIIGLCNSAKLHNNKKKDVGTFSFFKFKKI